jgi:hypothetical protein
MRHLGVPARNTARIAVRGAPAVVARAAAAGHVDLSQLFAVLREPEWSASQQLHDRLSGGTEWFTCAPGQAGRACRAGFPRRQRWRALFGALAAIRPGRFGGRPTGTTKGSCRGSALGSQSESFHHQVESRHLNTPNRWLPPAARENSTLHGDHQANGGAFIVHVGHRRDVVELQ